MNMKRKIAAAVGAATVLVTGAGVTAATANDPWEGYECESVYSGGGWISFCTYVGTPADPAPTDPAEPTDPSTPAASIQRIAGADRYETSALISQVSFEPGVAVVYIANGSTLVDALGAGAAAQGAGPVLAVPGTGTLPTATAAELARLNPASIVIVGDPRSVSDDIAVQVAEAAAR